MTERYYLVKFMIGGYETSVLMCGSEQSVVQTIQKTISSPLLLLSVSKSVAYALQTDLGMKVYACLSNDMSNDVEETIITQTVIDPVEEDPDFQTNT